MSLPPAFSDEQLARLPGASPTPAQPPPSAASARGLRSIAGRGRALARRLVARAVRPHLAPLAERLTSLQQGALEVADLERRVRGLEVGSAASGGADGPAGLQAELAVLRARVEALEAVIEARSGPTTG
jgi:cell division protein FtsB